MNRKISAGTIARTAVLALALINQILTTTGHPVIPINDEQLVDAITLTATIVTSVIAWWKNSSFTQEAIVADEVMHKLKDGEISTDVVEEIVND